jgi:hypothetical protein
LYDIQQPIEVPDLIQILVQCLVIASLLVEG